MDDKLSEKETMRIIRALMKGEAWQFVNIDLLPRWGTGLDPVEILTEAQDLVREIAKIIVSREEVLWPKIHHALAAIRHEYDLGARRLAVMTSIQEGRDRYPREQERSEWPITEMCRNCWIWTGESPCQGCGHEVKFSSRDEAFERAQSAALSRMSAYLVWAAPEFWDADYSLLLRALDENVSIPSIARDLCLSVHAFGDTIDGLSKQEATKKKIVLRKLFEVTASNARRKDLLAEGGRGGGEEVGGGKVGLPLGRAASPAHSSGHAGRNQPKPKPKPKPEPKPRQR